MIHLEGEEVERFKESFGYPEDAELALIMPDEVSEMLDGALCGKCDNMMAFFCDGDIACRIGDKERICKPCMKQCKHFVSKEEKWQDVGLTIEIKEGGER